MPAQFFVADSCFPQTLDVLRQVSPTLQSLGTRGTPVVRRLQPLTGELATFSSAFGPVTQTLDQGAAIARAWSLVHGFTMLLLDNRLSDILRRMPEGTDVETLLGAMLTANLSRAS